MFRHTQLLLRRFLAASDRVRGERDRTSPDFSRILNPNNEHPGSIAKTQRVTITAERHQFRWAHSHQSYEMYQTRGESTKNQDALHSWGFIGIGEIKRSAHFPRN